MEQLFPVINKENFSVSCSFVNYIWVELCKNTYLSDNASSIFIIYEMCTICSGIYTKKSHFSPLINSVFRFRCLAINNNITEAAESFLMIDMFCKTHLSVELSALWSDENNYFSSTPGSQNIFRRRTFCCRKGLLCEVS